MNANAGKSIGEENEVRQIQWLSKPNADKIHGFMVLYLGRREDTEKLLQWVVDFGGLFVSSSGHSDCLLSIWVTSQRPQPDCSRKHP